MFSSLLNAIKTPLQLNSPEDENILKSPVSHVAAGLESLHLEDEVGVPGSFSYGPSTASHRRGLHADASGLPTLAESDISMRMAQDKNANDPLSPTLEQMETLVTAATMTSSPVDVSDHSRLFSSLSEIYQHRGSQIPSSLQPLDVPAALQSLATVSKTPPLLPASRPGRQFGRIPVPLSHLQTLPAPKHGKVASDEVKELAGLSELLRNLQSDILGDAFDSLSEDVKCQKLDNATAFVMDVLARIAKLNENAKDRAKMASYRGGRLNPDISAETRASMTQNLKTFHAQICALYAPFLSKRPLVIDADYVYNADFTYLDQLSQVVILLAVICNMIIGLSTLQTDFLINATVMCVKLGMSTVGSCNGSDSAHDFSPSQNGILRDMPSSLSAALKKFGADGRFEFHATCPSCSYTHPAISLPGPNLYEYPTHCTNRIVGEAGISVCGNELLTRRRDGTMQPIKPYLVSSLPDYLTRSLSDETYLLQSINATDEALRAIRDGDEQIGVQNVFEAVFIKDFKGPDGKLFVDRGNKIRLAFSIHTDFFNPQGNTHRGAHQSLGIISCANLALDPAIRNLPEYIFHAAIIPGPFEPKANDKVDELDHFLRPVIKQFVQTWRPGLRISRTAMSESEATVEAGILLSVNDLPAARKVAGFAGHTSQFICSVCRLFGKQSLFNTDHSQWIPRDKDELRHWATAYRDAQTLKERKTILKTHGVRWSSLWLLDYWDPARMLVIDSMHCILEGLVQFQCRGVLRLDASKRQFSPKGFKYAFDWQWASYDPELAIHIELAVKHVPQVVKIQDALCWAIEGEQSLSLDELWTRLDGNVSDALQFVAWSLDLSPTLNNINPLISSLYVERAKRKSKKRNRDNIQFPVGKPPSQKNHFIALLLDWRLKQSRDASKFVVETGRPETLAYIQQVIQKTVTPAWLNSVPKDFGEAKAGTLKADEWRTLSTVFIPLPLSRSGAISMVPLLLKMIQKQDFCYRLLITQWPCFKL
ncbi:hypothetical protein D9757_015004 [Collybiopsis confluens]|uniref:Uncharacterized protein n=1 Tax=Collybiopsis confluens TaxID=2823264 RepID=A0A8H5FP43_9AGAR|nr:hypothetical protein D9757_015004 [Collybiopsis confluens]